MAIAGNAAGPAGATPASPEAPLLGVGRDDDPAALSAPGATPAAGTACPCSRVTNVTIRRMSRSVRPNDVRLISGRIRCRVIALARVNSRSPSAPWIRPNPDSPTPPNGSAGTIANPSTELTEVIPARNQRAAAMAAERSRANTADPSP